MCLNDITNVAQSSTRVLCNASEPRAVQHKMSKPTITIKTNVYGLPIIKRKGNAVLAPCDLTNDIGIPILTLIVVGNCFTLQLCALAIVVYKMNYLLNLLSVVANQAATTANPESVVEKKN